MPTRANTAILQLRGGTCAASLSILLEAMYRKVDEGAAFMYLLFDMRGGPLSEALAFHNAIRAFPVPVAGHCVGEVASGGVLVFLACEPRYICSNARVIIHGAGYTINSPDPTTTLPGYQLREYLAITDHMDTVQTSVLLERTSMSAEEIAADLSRGLVSHDAAWAVSRGIAHKILDLTRTTPGRPEILPAPAATAGA